MVFPKGPLSKGILRIGADGFRWNPVQNPNLSRMGAGSFKRDHREPQTRPKGASNATERSLKRDHREPQTRLQGASNATARSLKRDHREPQTRPQGAPNATARSFKRDHREPQTRPQGASNATARSLKRDHREPQTQLQGAPNATTGSSYSLRTGGLLSSSRGDTLVFFSNSCWSIPLDLALSIISTAFSGLPISI
jgi:hypothetical protein